MNLEKLISELQERNSKKYDQFLDECNNPPSPPNRNAEDYSQGWNDALLNLKGIGLENFTTDTAHQVALTVISEIKMKGDTGKLTPFQETVNTYIKNRGEEIMKKVDHLNTLEAKIKE